VWKQFSGVSADPANVRGQRTRFQHERKRRRKAALRTPIRTDRCDRGDAVRELADHVITRTERLLNFENCYGKGITQALEKAQDVHLAAYEAGTPDPQALAERLATGALQSGWGVLRDGRCDGITASRPRSSPPGPWSGTPRSPT